MQKYLVPRALIEYPDVDVLFAANPCRNAVLFIHGFSGDAIKTWSDFHELLPDAPRFDGYDLYFYGYDGLRAQIHSSAALFRMFLDRMLGQTPDFLRANLPFIVPTRAANFEYDRLLVVAHSLGAVIVRRALLDASQPAASWVSKVQLALFAPAHSGANVAKLALEAADGLSFLRPFASLAKFVSPLIDELQPGSDVLRQLAEETSAAIKDGANAHLTAKLVVIAEYDDIVRNARFAGDPPPFAIPAATHSSVCKPNTKFKRPLEYLERCL